ncbi:hypothetical protein ACJQWK_02604 [Exserohilum turcicum]
MKLQLNLHTRRKPLLLDFSFLARVLCEFHVDAFCPTLIHSRYTGLSRPSSIIHITTAPSPFPTHSHSKKRIAIPVFPSLSHGNIITIISRPRSTTRQTPEEERKKE